MIQEMPELKAVEEWVAKTCQHSMFLQRKHLVSAQTPPGGGLGETMFSVHRRKYSTCSEDPLFSV